MIVVERVADAEGRRGDDVDPAPAAADADRIGQRERPAARRLLVAPGCGEQRHERLRAPVGRRDLGTVHLDLEVVDAEPGGRGEQVLDRLDTRAVLSDRRRPVRVHDALRRRRDVIAAHPEDDARVFGGGREGDPGWLAGMETDPVQRDRLSDRMLSHEPERNEQPRCHWGLPRVKYLKCLKVSSAPGLCKHRHSGVDDTLRGPECPKSETGASRRQTSTITLTSWRPCRSPTLVWCRVAALTMVPGRWRGGSRGSPWSTPWTSVSLQART